MRGKGEGSVFKDTTTGLWTAVIELPARNGKRRRKTIRRKRKADLLTVLADEMRLLKSNGDLITNGQTVAQYLTYWVDKVAVKEVRPNTLDGYRRTINNHIIPTIGNVRLDRMTGPHVARVHAAILDKGLSSTTALLAHRTMSVAFKNAVNEERMLTNPASKTKPPRKAVAPQEAFDVDEAKAVLLHVAKDPLMGARWATSLLTGARRGEVIGLELDRVHEDHLDLSWQLQRLPLSDVTGRPTVPADFEYKHLSGGLYLVRPKSDAGKREFTLFEPLKSILARHIENMEPNRYGLVFAIDGAPIDPDRDTKNWKKVLKETGIQKNVVLHGLRHTAVDLLFLSGMPEDLIGELVGHSTRSVTRAYKSRGATSRARQQAALEHFAALFTQASDARSGTPAAIDQ